MPLHSPPSWSWRYRLILGFVLVALPLLALVVLANRSLDATIIESRGLNDRIYAQSRTVQRVLEKASDVERKARLFILFSDPALRQPYERDSYEQVRAALQQALGGLRALSLDQAIVLRANELAAKEELIHQQLARWNPQQQPAPAIDQAFLGLREAVSGLARQFDSHVDETFARLQSEAMTRQQRLLLGSGLLLAASLGVLALWLRWLERAQAQHWRGPEVPAESAAAPLASHPDGGKA